MVIDYGYFYYDVDLDDICKALAKIICDQYYGEKAKDNEVMTSTATFIHKSDLIEILYNDYKDEIKEFFRDRAENWYNECREQWVDDMGLRPKL